VSDRPVPVRAVLERLEAELSSRGVKLVYDDLKGEGGLCRVKGRPWLIVNRRASAETRIRILREALVRLPAPAAGGGEQPAPVAEPARIGRQS